MFLLSILPILAVCTALFVFGVYMFLHPEKIGAKIQGINNNKKTNLSITPKNIGMIKIFGVVVAVISLLVFINAINTAYRANTIMNKFNNIQQEIEGKRQELDNIQQDSTNF